MFKLELYDNKLIISKNNCIVLSMYNVKIKQLNNIIEVYKDNKFICYINKSKLG